MKKQTYTQEEFVTSQAHDLLFASLYMDMEDVVKATKALSKRPEIGAQILETLGRMMNEEQPKFLLATPPKELKKVVKTRVEQWKQSIGTPTMHQYASLSKYWGVPVGDVIGERITPKVVYDLLDCFVVGQQAYKRELSTRFYINLMKKNKRVCTKELPNSNLLVYGESGSGKTSTIQTLARHFDVPFIEIHCNTVVGEGYVGTNIPSFFTGAWLECKGESDEEKKAEISHAVVCFDEFDKLLANKEFGDIIFNEVLSLIDDNGEVRFRVGYHHTNDYVTVSTKQMMFVFTGVFEGLDKLKSGDGLGFRGGVAESKSSVDSIDLVRYGIKPEIVGRIQNYISVDHLSAEDLYELLNSKMDSPLNDFLNYFRQNDIEIAFTEEAKKLLAQTACNRKLGVRGLKGLINNVLREAMFNLSDESLEITEDFVKQNIQ